MANLSVLLVEDKLSDVWRIVEAFKANNIQNDLSVVGGGAETIDFLKKKGKYQEAPRPDIVLLDLKIPKKNGYKVLKSAKEDPETAMIPVIVLSNSDT